MSYEENSEKFMGKFVEEYFQLELKCAKELIEAHNIDAEETHLIILNSIANYFGNHLWKHSGENVETFKRNLANTISGLLEWANERINAKGEVS